jgi:hypothetical protein
MIIIIIIIIIMIIIIIIIMSIIIIIIIIMSIIMIIMMMMMTMMITIVIIIIVATDPLPACWMCTTQLSGSIPEDEMDHLPEILEKYIETLHASCEEAKAYTLEMLYEDFTMCTTMLYIGERKENNACLLIFWCSCPDFRL